MAVKKGHIVTEETKRKISAANKGKIKTEEHRKKLGVSHLGKKHNLEQIKKLKLNAKTNPNYGMKGKHFSEETKHKMSISRKQYLEEHPDILKKRRKPQSEETKIKISESHKGDKHPNWLGGKSFEPYTIDFNKRFKQAIILRDNNCLICGSNKRLSVHHINYNKLESFKENCICLCSSCHTKTNFNRQQWQTFCRSLLLEKYGYKYSEDGKVIIELKEAI